ncbi:MAG: aminoacyl-tRNA hydrolase [Syntrophothermus sp.]
MGIGNPGNRYSLTRHNAGFMLLDQFAEKHKLGFRSSKKDYIYARGEFNDSPFLLIKPTTYVNLSGQAAADVLSEYLIPPEDLLVVCDDINLDTGRLKIKASGGDGGHNGVNSIIYHLNSDQFPRLRFGIGRDFQAGQMADYVLSRFPDNELPMLNEAMTFGVQLLESFIAGGLKSALDFYSKAMKPGKDPGQKTE